RGGVQWIVNPPHAKDDVFGLGTLELIGTYRLTPNITIFVDAQGFVGPGPDQALGTLSRLNGDADHLGSPDSRILLREASIRIQSPDTKVRFNIGQLDVTHYFDRNFFAEDETRQFQNAAITGNPMLRNPLNSPASAIRLSQGDWRYAFGVWAPGDVDGDMS